MATENVKKTKAPAKAKAKAAGETEGTVKAAAARAKKAVKARATVEVAAVVVAPSHSEIARLAERFWAERGWQDGFAEQDWLRAEQELLRVAS